MNGQQRTRDKKPEVKTGNLVSRIQKAESSRSVNLPIDQLFHLHGAIGNQAVGRLIQQSRTGGRGAGVIQAKLTINRPDDIYEQEADRVAEQVMRIPETSAQHQSRAEAAEEVRPQRQATAHDPPISEAPPIVHEALSTPGQPLDTQTRALFEPRFGHDFSQVRIHADAKADESAKAVSANAYTVGGHIAFAKGHYQPTTQQGRELVAHELTHVVQQCQGVMSMKLQLSPADDILPELSRMLPPTSREARAAIFERRERLRQIFWSIAPADAEALCNRLASRREGDELSMQFHDILDSAVRIEMLNILKSKIRELRQRPSIPSVPRLTMPSQGSESVVGRTRLPPAQQWSEPGSIPVPLEITPQGMPTPPALSPEAMGGDIASTAIETTTDMLEATGSELLSLIGAVQLAYTLTKLWGAAWEINDPYYWALGFSYGFVARALQEPVPGPSFPLDPSTGEPRPRFTSDEEGRKLRKIAEDRWRDGAAAGYNAVERAGDVHQYIAEAEDFWEFLRGYQEFQTRGWERMFALWDLRNYIRDHPGMASQVVNEIFHSLLRANEDLYGRVGDIQLSWPPPPVQRE